jgi:3-oxoacyl-(acyl-carrier-protein) synthase
VAAIRSFDASTFPVRIGAEVKHFDAAARIRDRKLLKHASRSQRFALAAAAEALADAGIRPEPHNAHRWGFIAGRHDVVTLTNCGPCIRFAKGTANLIRRVW